MEYQVSFRLIIELAELQHNGTSVRKVPKQNVVALLGRPNLTPYVIDLELKKAIQMDVRFLMINLATEREDIYLILKYFDMDLSWINLYGCSSFKSTDIISYSSINLKFV